jgi:sugar phosphate isomerase/epimerase
MHPRLSFNSICNGPTSLDQDYDIWRELGAACVGIQAGKLEAVGWQAGIDKVLAEGMRVSTLLHPVSFHLDAAKAVKSESIYTTGGRRGQLSWEEAAEAFVEAIKPVVAHARTAGVPILIEQVPALYVDFAFVHNLRDALHVAEAAGIGVCLDLWHFWSESNLHANMDRALPGCRLVQISDYTLGDRSYPCRTVPGDGVMPIEALMKRIVAAGYKGSFDFELIGPRIEKEGAASALRRAGLYMTAMLERLGV